MTIDINSILGFLGGSLATLIIKEVINQINRKQDFKRELIKATYLKKLDKAEKAIAFYRTYLNQITLLKNSYQTVLKAVNESEEKDIDIEIIQEVLEHNSKAFSELSGEKYFETNSIHLYFELDDEERWSEDDQELFIKSLAETKSIDNDIEFLISLYNSHLNKNETNQAEYYWNESLKLLPVYVNSLQKVIDILEKNKIASRAVISRLKEQFTQY